MEINSEYKNIREHAHNAKYMSENNDTDRATNELSQAVYTLTDKVESLHVEIHTISSNVEDVKASVQENKEQIDKNLVEQLKEEGRKEYREQILNRSEDILAIITKTIALLAGLWALLQFLHNIL